MPINRPWFSPTFYIRIIIPETRKCHLVNENAMSPLSLSTLGRDWLQVTSTVVSVVGPCGDVFHHMLASFSKKNSQNDGKVIELSNHAKKIVSKCNHMAASAFLLSDLSGRGGIHS